MRRITYPRQWRLPFSSMRFAPFLFIVVVLILIVPFALANPPDPSSIAGIYDGADGDDVVTLVYETAGVEAVSLGSVLPLPRSSNVSLVSGPGTIHGLPRQQITRGPPSPSTLIIYDVAITSPTPCQIPRPYRSERRQFPFESSQDVGRCPYAGGR
jgi:hypothetical protein